jgi:hypothetical protein
MARVKSGTRMHGIPAAKEMREARDERRRKHDDAKAAWGSQRSLNNGPYLNPTVPDIPSRNFFSVTKVGVDEDIGALRIILDNIDAGIVPAPRSRGRPIDTNILRFVLDVLEREKCTLRVYQNSPAVMAVEKALATQGRTVSRATIQGWLRRLSDLRK